MEGYFVVADEEIPRMPACPCGSQSETWIAGKEAIAFRCHKCLNGEMVPVEMVYKPPTQAELGRFGNINFLTRSK